MRTTRLLRLGASHSDLATNLLSLGVLLFVTVFIATSVITLMADDHDKGNFYAPNEDERLQVRLPEGVALVGEQETPVV